jgi:hypothetical protein
MPREPPSIDQVLLQRSLALSSSFLLSDTTTNPSLGASTWAAGFGNLINVVVALHYKGELELETINAASKACSECWGVAGAWKNLNDCKDVVRKVALKLKQILVTISSVFLQRPFHPSFAGCQWTDVRGATCIRTL